MKYHGVIECWTVADRMTGVFTPGGRIVGVYTTPKRAEEERVRLTKDAPRGHKVTVCSVYADDLFGAVSGTEAARARS